MTKITQADTDAAESYYASGKMSVHHLAQAFADQRQIKITDAMIEAGEIGYVDAIKLGGMPIIIVGCDGNYTLHVPTNREYGK